MPSADAMDALFSASQVQAGDNQLKNIAGLVQEAVAAEDELATIEAMMEACKAKLNNLRQNLIPEAMKEAHTLDFTDAVTGAKVKLQMAVSGALGSPKTDEERRLKERKLDILVAHGAEEIVKLEVGVEFGKGRYSDATKLREALQATDNLPDVLQGMADAARAAGKPQAADALQAGSQRLRAVQGLSAKMERSIHHQTLASWLRKQLEKGAAIPMDDLGMWYGQVAKIERVKANG